MKKIIKNWFSQNFSDQKTAFRLLSIRDKRNVIFITALQSALSIIDLVGIALVGLLGALSVSGIQSDAPGNRITQILALIGLSGLSFQEQVAVIGILAAVVLITRSLLSIYFTKRTLYFFGMKSIQLAETILRKTMQRGLLGVRRSNSAKFIYLLTDSTNALYVGISASSVSLVSDIFLLFILFGSLMLVSPITAITVLILYGVIGILLHRVVGNKARVLGRVGAEASIALHSQVNRLINSFRELHVRNQLDIYEKAINSHKVSQIGTVAQLAFLPNVSKYVIESSVILTALIISGLQFAITDAKSAVSTLAIFMAAGARLTPALLRIQQNLIVLKSQSEPAKVAIYAAQDLLYTNLADDEPRIKIDRVSKNCEIVVKNLTFSYESNKEKFSIQSINLSIEKGEVVAFVGLSGSGKTTLIDLILGVLTPKSGQIEICGESPINFIKKNPHAIGYVPQDVYLFDGTIRDNLDLEVSGSKLTESDLWRALTIAQMEAFIEALPHKLYSDVGEGGWAVSGGQKQRLGIARALLTNPEILVLDEATSSLDASTENLITDAINELRGKTTILIVAHRLSTIKNADRIMFMASGKILGSGTFNELRETLPEFNQLATLMSI